MKKLFSSKYSEGSISFALLLLRFSLGILMIAHGYHFLLNFGSLSGRFSDPFHLGGTISLAFVIFAELFCAVLIVLGLMTRLACIPLIITMAVALYFSHHGRIFGAGERAALYLCGYIALLFTGPGKWSMDRMIGK